MATRNSAPAPGPRRLLPHLLAFFKAPRACYQALQRRHGDPFSVPSPLGGRMTVATAPALVQQAFALGPEATTTVDATAGMFYGSNSITVLEGQAHERMRRLLNAPLIQGRREAAAIMQRATLRHLDGLVPGRQFRADALCRQITMDVILHTVFGASEGEELDALRRAVLRLRDTLSVWLVFVPALRRRLGPWSPWTRFQDATAEVGRIMAPLIARARGGSGGSDVLAHLAQLRREDGGFEVTDGEIRDNLLTMLFAGHESTATALAWALYFVHREPGVLERLLAELAPDGAAVDATALGRTPYLDAVCREALRIEPVAPGVARRLKDELPLGHCTVPAGDIVMLSIDLAHRDPERYPEPDRFRPERFLERNPGSSVFFPFGGGRRHCIGAAMALQEMRVVLAVLLTRCRFALDEPKSVARVWNTGIMVPKTGIRLRLLEALPPRPTPDPAG